MADKEMIAAALAAGVLAAAPPVLDPLAAAKEAASLYFEVLRQLEREAQASKAQPESRRPEDFARHSCSAELQIPVPY